jgi:hypothetical protein
MTKLLLLVLAGALSGCALIERQHAAVTGNLLLDAGFQMRAAGTGDRDLPPREIVAQWDSGKALYIYADPDGCHCVYTGTTPQYERYRWLEARENILRETDGDAMNAASLEHTP